jgi:3-phenylpropionate/trans-cinnamate dioxygenase subunit alpha
MTWYLDAFSDRREGRLEIIGDIHKWVIPCNWKFPAENFGWDGYNTWWSHLSAMPIGSGGDFRVNPDANRVILSPGNGHCIIGVGPGTAADPPVPEILAYEAGIIPEVKSRLGPRLNLTGPIVGTVLSHFSKLRRTSRTFRFGTRARLRRPKSRPAYSLTRLLLPSLRDPRLADVQAFGPSGTFEQDDINNWQGCILLGRGVVARRYPLGYEMGLGREGFEMT